MGEVLEVGDGVTTSRVGQRVIVPGTSECGVCFYCSIGRPDQCSETFDRGGIWPHVADRRNGEPVSAAGNVGGYAEVMNVTANQVFPVETDLPDEWLSLLGCGITTGLGLGVQHRPGPAGSSVAIVGLGHLGLWMVQAARLATPARSSPSTRSPSRRELARHARRDALVDPSTKTPIAAVQALTEGAAPTTCSRPRPSPRPRRRRSCMSRRAGTVVLTSVERARRDGHLPAGRAGGSEP